MDIPPRDNGYPFAFFRSAEQKAAHDAQVLRCMMELSNNLNDRDLRNDFLERVGKAYRNTLDLSAMRRPYAVTSYLTRLMVRLMRGELVWQQQEGKWCLVKGRFVLAWLISNGNEFITDIHPAFFDEGYSAVDVDTPEQGETFLREWARRGTR